MKPDGVESENATPSDAPSLRRQAEESLRAQPTRSGGRLSHDEAIALVHELQVHQIELELQNEELVRTRREAEALRDRYADLYDFAPVGYFTLDRVGAIREANLAGAVQLGVDRGSLIGAWFATFLHPDNRAGFAVFCTRVLTGGTTEMCEVSLLARTGRGAWHAQLGGHADAAGAAEYIRLVVTDITDRWRIEDALRESEAKYRSLVDDDITGIFTTDHNGRILDCNPAFARMFRFASVEEARSTSITETYESPADWAALLDQLRRERRVEGDKCFRRRRDGGRIHVIENFIGEFNGAGDLIRIKGYAVDDTHRYQAEEALRESEETLQGIFRAAPVGIGIISGQAITMVNDQLCWMTRYTREELVGQDGHLLYPGDEAYNSVVQEVDDLVARDGMDAHETRWRRRDGTCFDLLLTHASLDPSRPFERIIFSVLDITKCRESERAIQVYTDELKRSNEELQRFAYVASHDLQEPLRTIVSFSELLKRRYRGLLDADADEFIDYIVEGGRRMQTLIKDLLQLSQIETEGKPPVKTDPRNVMADVLRILESPIHEANATVTVGDLPPVMVDAAQLALVFTNLIGNAVKYRRPDVPLEIRVSAEQEGTCWRFAVTDNGIGIEPVYFERIFVIFQRLHTRDEYEGTGIGLAIVRKIVERYGGRVRVESMLGEGATFFFTLPAA